RVLYRSMVIVIGPTPPGTGESHPATSATRPSTSPTHFPSTQLLPTSTTTAPGLTMSGVTSRGTPAAATSTSDRRQTPARYGVRVWATVTVASPPAGLAAVFFCRSIRASGLPTTLLRPTATTSRPARPLP